ncbi:MAG: formate hydrogenlyase [Methanomassiliicoccus sp.]|nr:MAG: formate hydrogenlyase [Methanomassiliicoccus sp.]
MMLLAMIQTLLLLALAPLFTGLIRKFKAFFQGRQGPSVLQPYRDLTKLFHKDSVISKDASWLFTATPYICMTAVITAALMIPFFTTSSINFIGDIIVVVYLFGMMRFFMALAGLDAGSAFGGMGSSREMTISAMVEPTILLSIFTMALISGTTRLGEISFNLATTGLDLVPPALFLALAAFFISTLAENARVPVDNPATHLELTMIHEAMILEHSGKQLALMEWSSMTKLLLYLVIMANTFLPWGIATEVTPMALIIGIFAVILKITLFSLAIAIIESSMAKMRLFRLPNLLTVSFSLSLLAVMSFYIL